jgi:HAD superfamily phosphatase (TIGR01668 family)
MRRIKKDIHTPAFVPDYMAKSLHEVDFDDLKKRGIKYIAFDADATLVSYRTNVLAPETKLLLQKNRKKFTKWVIASNRVGSGLMPLAESMDAQVIQATMFGRKPRRKFFNRVISHFGGKPQEIAMIGDKLIADVYGGNKAGLTTVWVEQLGATAKHDWLFRTRQFERWLMRKYL